MIRIIVEPITHLNENRVSLKFEENQAIVQILRSNFPSLKLSKSLGCFHISADSAYKSKLLSCFRGCAWLEFKKATCSIVETKKNPATELPVLTEEHRFRVEEFKNFLRSRRYSESTIKVYSESIVIFLRYYSHKSLEEIDNEDLINFNNSYILKNGYSSSYQNQLVNSVKSFFKAVSGYRMDIDLIHRPRPAKLLPNVLSKEEVKRIIMSPINMKHRVMLSMIYACGLRRSELLNLKPQDILSERKVIHIRQSKGKKDRIVPLSEVLLVQLREYFRLYKPSTWLFEGQIKGQQYSKKSLQNVLKQSLERCNIRKPVTLHWLRHSYATHLMESGTDLRYIQELLGHSSSKTTEIYTHVSTKSIENIRSPFDEL